MDDEGTEPEQGLLADVRVVDLTDAYGGLCARVLGDLGAEVVRIEAPGGGGGRRRVPAGPDGTSLHHVHRNAGKAVVTLDPLVAADRATVDGLLAGADIAVTGRGWGGARADLAPAVLVERHPHLVVAALTPFGSTGPASEWASTELVAQSMAGVVYRSGVAELPPVAAPGSYCEDVGAVVAAMAALMALHQGRVDGIGQVVDVSAVLALGQCTDMALPLWGLLGFDQVRAGSGLYPLFECADGQARIVLPMTPGDWRNLITWMGSPPEWSGPGWEGAMLGDEQREAVLARLPDQFAGRTREAVTAEAEAAGVRVTPVLTPAEVLSNEHMVGRATFLSVAMGGRVGALFAGLHSVDGVRAAVDGAARSLDGPPGWPARPRSPEPTPPVALPLAGLRMLEVGTGLAAPEAGRVFAEWGADVIRVESRRHPDFQRMVLGGEMNPAFATANRSTRTIAADLSTEAGRELVRSLLPHVDVLVENNASGVIDRLGLGWDVVSQVNPALVMVSTQLYGDRGPWAGRKGYGPSARAVGGVTWLWAHGPDAPKGIMTIHPDHLAGRLAALGALAGLRARERTGAGCRVDVAQFEVVAGLLGDLFLAESLQPGSVQPNGNGSDRHAPWGLFRCREDEGSESWLALCVTSDAAWSAVVDVADGAIDDRPAWRTESGRLAEVDALEAAVAAWLVARDAGESEAALQAAGVAAGQVLHPRLQVTHPHFLARGWPVPVDQPGSGPVLFEGPAFVGTRMGSPRCGPAPLPGEHTADVCRGLLGLTEAEIEQLVVDGAIDPLPDL